MKHAPRIKQSRRNLTGKAVQRIRMASAPKITQEDMVGRLARQGIQINQSQVAKIESGDRPILDYELAAIAKALKVPVQALFD
ncbi:MAG TPA: helix-turn-helix transcriptional regulator [Opitutaceae bacterium]|nr:helix-turn-helix transcriptional regulator [Opitutaceae bacterium]